MRMSFSKTIIFSAIAGLFSGVVGALLVFLMAAKPVEPSPSDMSLITRVPSASAKAQFNITEAKRSLVMVYSADKKGLLPFSDLTTFGLALTSDGLVAIPKYLKTPANFLATSVEHDSFVLEFARDQQGAVFNSSESGLTFFKMKPTAGKTPRVKPIEFYPYENVYVGQTVFSFDQTTKAVSLREITKIGLSSTSPQLPLSSDALVGALTVSGEPKAGTFIFSADGYLLGIVLKDETVLPAEFLGNMLRGYLKTGKYSKTELGLQVLDLSQFVIAPDSFPSEGFLIQDTKARPMAKAANFTDQALLKKGDIVVSFDGQRLGQSLPLQLLLQRYQPGVEVELGVLRAGEEKKIKVTLGGK